MGQKAAVAVEHHLPDEGDDGDGEDAGGEEDAAQDAVHPRRPVHRQRQGQGERRHHGHGQDDEQHRVAHGAPEQAVVQEIGVVGETDEGPVRAYELPVVQADPHALAQGIEQEDGEDEEVGGDVEVALQRVAADRAFARRCRHRHRNGPGACGHQAAPRTRSSSRRGVAAASSGPKTWRAWRGASSDTGWPKRTPMSPRASGHDLVTGGQRHVDQGEVAQLLDQRDLAAQGTLAPRRSPGIRDGCRP